MSALTAAVIVRPRSW
jgi:hypothetical protein